MISVCIATYNGEKYIKEQLDSILCQLNLDDEVIISDDGSTDTTLAIIESYQDDRISLYKNAFKNVVLNFEFVINKANGDYIFLSDQDDIWHKDKVELYMKSFSENPEAILTISDLQIIDKNGLLLDKVFYKNKFTSNLGKNLVVNNFIGCAMAFRSEVKKSILPFPKNIAMHDWWIGTCCIILGEIHFIDMKLNFYRRHENNVTKEGGAEFATKIKWRLNLIKNLIVRCLNIKSASSKTYPV
jgi:glycosyltransferase involved in cell wall biosynthesis